MVSLNDKMGILLNTLEDTFKEYEKHLPDMAKKMFKPTMATLRVMLFITPEEKIREKIEKVHLMYEAVMNCEHATKDEFKEHMQELLKTWT